MMNTYVSIKRVAMLGVLAMTIFTSINQLSASVGYCSGLACDTAGDCGMDCFCNKTLRMCEDLQE